MTARRALPARFPPTGAWPAQMRADMAAAFLDYENTVAFAAAVKRGEAPPPTALRRKGRSREPVWSRAELDRFVAPSLGAAQNAEQGLAALVPSR